MPTARKLAPLLALLLASVIPGRANAATISKIDKSHTKLMLNLTKDEAGRLKVSDRVVIKDDSGNVKAVGSIVKIKKSQAMVQLDHVDVESGLKVTVGIDDGAAPTSGGSSSGKAGAFNAELELAAMPYASLFTDDGTPGADDTTLDTNSILPLPVGNLGLRFYSRFGDFSLGPEIAYFKHDLALATKTTTTTEPASDAVPETNADKLTVTLMQAGACTKYEFGLNEGSKFGFVPRLCVGYIGKTGKSVNLNYKDSGTYVEIGPGIYYKFGESVGLGLSVDYYRSSIAATTIAVPDEGGASTSGIVDVRTNTKEGRTHLGIGYALFFLF